MLKIQHRMHPTICKFISNTFYNNVLIDDSNTSLKITSLPLYNYLNPKHVLTFFDLPYSKEAFNNNSWCNYANVEFVSNLVSIYQDHFKKFNPSIGIITPYRRQLDNYKNFPNIFGAFTIDSCQGKEMDFVILDLTRTTDLIFLKDTRINVALSRAKKFLTVIGNTWCQNEIILSLIKYCKENKSYIQVSESFSKDNVYLNLKKANILYSD